MSTQVLMPRLGESVDEGTISKWLKAIGDPVAQYEPLLEVNTDKVDSEIPSPAAGVVLEILVPEGTLVQVGTPLARIGAPGEAASGGDQPERASTPPPATETASVTAPAPQAAPSTPAAVPGAGKDRELGFISPVVAKIARQENLDLRQVPGSGQAGRITKQDVLDYLEKRPGAPALAQPPASSLPSIHPSISQPVPAGSAAVSPGKILPLNNVRKAIAEHMVLSKHTSPHVTTVMEADLSQVIAHRNANKEQYARDGVNLTFTGYFMAATVTALKAYPIVNSSWNEAGIVLHPQINVGMAVSLGDEGLIVPVIKNADGLSLLGLARMINDLASRARGHQLKPDEVKGGTFTITNHGISGSLFASPIINQPQCAILGVGAIQKRVVVVSDPVQGDTIGIRSMAYLTLTFDHRILDGAIADYFLGKVVESLQTWNIQSRGA
ncbi:MAG TPA: dihydrolipoamide acetyltransferase family protein [Anaerolineales bacterium]|nr:dihydrolipoamide acetyltransferase family protein [Anaerolineales bacterium]